MRPEHAPAHDVQDQTLADYRPRGSPPDKHDPWPCRLASLLNPTHLQLLGQGAGSERFVDDVAALNHDPRQRRVQARRGEERVDPLEQFG